MFYSLEAILMMRKIAFVIHEDTHYQKNSLSMTTQRYFVIRSERNGVCIEELSLISEMVVKCSCFCLLFNALSFFTLVFYLSLLFSYFLFLFIEFVYTFPFSVLNYT